MLGLLDTWHLPSMWPPVLGQVSFWLKLSCICLLQGWGIGSGVVVLARRTDVASFIF